MSRIVILDKTVADKIAAGEVVERPASVIKELVENSIDAGAKNIIINLEQGGQSVIEIIDDGAGMSAEEAELSIKRFATSKIREWEDLEDIRTFGFRGEALPSIAAVSKMEIFTRRREDEIGTRVYIEGGIVKEITEVGTPEGTRIRIMDLFFNTPARKKFLKTPASETANIVGIAEKLSLANPDLSLRLTSNGREIFDFPSSMTTRERILKIWGLPMDYNAINIEHETSNIRISGYAGRPDKLKSQRTFQIFFINGRYIKDTMISHALLESYSPLIPQGKYPIALLFIDLPGKDVDINVHPNKMEVRFANPSDIFRAVRESIRKEVQGFEYSLTLPASAACSAPSSSGTTTVRYDISKDPFNPNSIQAGASSQSFNGSYNESGSTRVSKSGSPFAYTPSMPLEFVAEKPQPIPAYIEDESPEDLQVRAEATRQAFHAFAQIRKTYIAGVTGDEIWVIDQHTAHERINYEELSHIDTLNSKSQRLLFPITIDVPATLHNFLLDKTEEFDRLGYEVEPFGGNSIIIKSVPFGMKKLDNKDTLLAILEEVANGHPYRNIEAFVDKLRSTTACKASVKAGDTLTTEEMNALVNKLVNMDYSSFCPHGRPVIVKISKEHLDRMFHRI